MPPKSQKQKKDMFKNYSDARKYFIQSFDTFQKFFNNRDNSTSFQKTIEILHNEVFLKYSILHNIETILPEIQEKYNPNSFCLFHFLEDCINENIYEIFLQGLQKVPKDKANDCEKFIHLSIFICENEKYKILKSFYEPLQMNPNIMEETQSLQEIKTLLKKYIENCEKRMKWIWDDLHQNYQEWEFSQFEMHEYIREKQIEFFYEKVNKAEEELKKKVDENKKEIISLEN